MRRVYLYDIVVVVVYTSQKDKKKLCKKSKVRRKKIKFHFFTPRTSHLLLFFVKFESIAYILLTVMWIPKFE